MIQSLTALPLCENLIIDLSLSIVLDGFDRVALLSRLEPAVVQSFSEDELVGGSSSEMPRICFIVKSRICYSKLWCCKKTHINLHLLHRKFKIKFDFTRKNNHLRNVTFGGRFKRRSERNIENLQLILITADNLICLRTFLNFRN